MEFVPLLALPFLINKILDWVREILPDRLEAKVVIPISWALGVVLTFAFALSDWGSEMMVGDKAFADINPVSLVIVGLVIGASAGIISDFKPNRLTSSQVQQAVDQADTVVVESPDASEIVTKTNVAQLAEAEGIDPSSL